MNTEEVKEWMSIADEDFYSAKILNNAERKFYEIICYHCAQAVEKNLKGYLVYNNIIPKKTHDLSYLVGCCIEIDNNFLIIKPECEFLNQYSKDIRYPRRYEVTDGDVILSFAAVEKIRNCKPIVDCRNIIENE